jgi:hypothetical protein
MAVASQVCDCRRPIVLEASAPRFFGQVSGGAGAGSIWFAMRSYVFGGTLPQRRVFLVSDLRGDLRDRDVALDHGFGRPSGLADRYSLVPWVVGTPIGG